MMNRPAPDGNIARIAGDYVRELAPRGYPPRDWLKLIPLLWAIVGEAITVGHEGTTETETDTPARHSGTVGYGPFVVLEPACGGA